MKCCQCKKKLNLVNEQKISRTQECPYCSLSLHSCKMCLYYCQNAYNQCRETSADRITDKEKANFCDYYKLGDPQENNPDKQSILDSANLLFKD